MFSVLRRIPFTLVLLVALIGAGIYGRAHEGMLDAELHHQVGHSPRLLFDGHWQRLFTSLLFTAGGWRFYTSLVMLTFAVGWAEFAFGTRGAALTFFGVHLATLLIMAVVVAWSLSWLETEHGRLLLDARDVGPSAGYYGCLGLVVASLSPSKRRAIAAGILLLLVVRLVWSTIQLSAEGREMSADVAHLIAFPLGFVAGVVVCRRQHSQRD